MYSTYSKLYVEVFCVIIPRIAVTYIKTLDTFENLIALSRIFLVLK